MKLAHGILVGIGRSGIAIMLVAGTLVVACDSSDGAGAGRESSFLQRCVASGCGAGLECLCVVCTRTCVAADVALLDGGVQSTSSIGSSACRESAPAVCAPEPAQGVRKSELDSCVAGAVDSGVATCPTWT